MVRHVAAALALAVAASLTLVCAPASAADPFLPAPAHGEAAIGALGHRLPEAARLNHMSPNALQHLLRHDSTAWISREGKMFFVDQAFAAPDGEPVTTGSSLAYPTSQTFTLHSRPGASRLIYLDFNGHTVAGTVWNVNYGLLNTYREGWSLDGDPAFSVTEHAAIQEIWQRVTEDFAPWDVDVTTQAPAESALERSSMTDLNYGVRVLVTNNDDAWAKICQRNCGGISVIDYYGDATDVPTSYWQPSWVFPAGSGKHAKNIAESAAHEAGHALGLSHDGQGANAYYAGAAGWAPIMGNGYRQPITQWSRGSYAGATNSQDDFAIISGYLNVLGDTAGSRVQSAAPFTSAWQRIGSASDVDVYDLGTCNGMLRVSALTAPMGPDLDLRLELLDHNGTVITTADPLSTPLDSFVALGMGATLSRSTRNEHHYVRVSGVGRGTADNGYTDYASVGQFRLVKACF